MEVKHSAACFGSCPRHPWRDEEKLIEVKDVKPHVVRDIKVQSACNWLILIEML